MYSGIYHRALNKRRQKIHLSTNSKYLFSELEKKAQEHAEASSDHSKRVALFYLHPFPLNRFHRNRSQYWVFKQTELEQDFSKSTSYRNLGYEYEDTTSPPGKIYEGVLHGRIFHVSRWGLNEKICTIVMEEDPLTEMGASAPKMVHSSGTSIGFGKNDFGESGFYGDDVGGTQYRRRARILQTPNDYSHDHSSTHDRKEGDTPHKRYTLNVYEEDGCQFAEDAALHQAKVSVHYTIGCMPTWNWHLRRVHKIQVRDEKKKL